MKREFSAGGIIFNKEGQVLLTQHSTNKSWGFPKGHPNEGEGMKQAALREVKEEGGVEVEIINSVGQSKYKYTLNGEEIFKIVTIYLMKYVSGDIKDHDWEVSDSGWFTPDEALKKLSFSNDKTLFKKAVGMYEQL
ncbi:MAG: NUDIX domain-containing protein [Candidatus Daviesbacteria bacterium]|nr:NUDIX domain-containing protein [Candidatus Daviesbacteria bacterium]